jgi:hypothetical protein
LSAANSKAYHLLQHNDCILYENWQGAANWVRVLLELHVLCLLPLLL